VVNSEAKIIEVYEKILAKEHELETSKEQTRLLEAKNLEHLA